MSRTISDSERRARLVFRHRLGPQDPNDDAAKSSPFDISRSVVALHSSDPGSVYLSVLARSPSTTIESVSSALYEGRVLARVHGMRRTLWVTGIDTAADIIAASSTRLVRAERRRLASFLADHGVGDPEAWIDEARAEILDFVAHIGLVDTRTVGEALPHRAIGFEVAAGKKYAGTVTAHTRILLILGFEGCIVRAAPLGSWIASQYRWAEPSSWFDRPLVGDHESNSGGQPPSSRVAEAQAAVIERYLRAFGPVTTDDVVWWTGWPKGVVTRALGEVAATEVDLGGSIGWLSSSDNFSMTPDLGAAADRSVALLPALDPTTMGWKHRDHYLDPAMTVHLFDRNGNGGPTIWVGGRVVGGWSQRDDGEMAYRLLTDVGTEATRAIEDELARLAELIGDTRYKVRFPNPLNTELRR